MKKIVLTAGILAFSCIPGFSVDTPPDMMQKLEQAGGISISNAGPGKYLAMLPQVKLSNEEWTNTAINWRASTSKEPTLNAPNIVLNPKAYPYNSFSGYTLTVIVDLFWKSDYLGNRYDDNLDKSTVL